MSDSLAKPSRVELEGEYDVARRSEVVSLFTAIPADGPVIIDLSKVTYLDSLFMQELILLNRRLGKLPITLVGANPNIRRLLQIVGFDQLFQIGD